MRRGISAAAVLAALLTACSSGDGGDATGSGATPGGAPEQTSLAERCLSAIPEPDLVEREEIEGPDGLRLVAGVFGAGAAEESGTAVVLLHQIGGSGLCGWGPWATQAAHAGIAAVAVDLCGYGESVCAERWSSDPAAQVGVAADWAREQLGADRVVVVGASMGGSQTVRAVAGGAPVDAWADVSGPSAWDGVPLSSVAGSVDAPGLVIYARSDGAAEYRAAEQLADRTGARFVDGGSGHGWELLTRIPDGGLTRAGRILLAFTQSG